jgi:ATP-binding cassette subfamily B protein
MVDTAVIPGILLESMIPMLQALAMLIAIGAVTISLSPTLALIGLAIAPLMLILSWPFGKSLRKQWHEIKDLDTSVMGRLQEVFAAVRVIKSFGKEQGETDRLFKLAEKGVDLRMKVAITQGKFTALTKLCTALATAAFLFVGAGMVRDNQMALGDLMMVGALMVQFFSPLQLLIGQIATMQSSLASAERVLSLLDQAPEVIERPDARAMDRTAGAVTFSNVSFSYEEGQPILKDVAFDVPVGSRLGIAGETGAGKTTLMNLLTRLYDPGSGAILLDGIDLRDIKIDDLRQQFAVVLQDPVLFKKSIAENISFSQPDATTEQIQEAAKLANAHGFISRMHDGYDTIVGERGQRLSGGERQRISLARAFLKNAPILILDEPTSSVDMRTEAAIMEALQRLMEGRTTFIIAHRPSTLEICDKVLVLQKGKVIAFASPDSMGSLNDLMMFTEEDEDQDDGS